MMCALTRVTLQPYSIALIAGDLPMGAVALRPDLSAPSPGHFEPSQQCFLRNVGCVGDTFLTFFFFFFAQEADRFSLGFINREACGCPMVALVPLIGIYTDQRQSHTQTP